MSDIMGSLRTDFSSFISEHGVPLKVQNNALAYDAADYDVGTLSASGTLQTGSGFMLPVSNKNGDDRRYLEQGLITQADKKVFIPSGIEINEKADVVIDAGSWGVIDKGIIRYPDETRIVYTRVYVRTKRP